MNINFKNSCSKLIMERLKAIMKAFRNETKQMIYSYLLIYKELTLEQLSNLLNKSKSTIHYHMQNLLKAELILEETKPGSKTIYYRLTMFRIDKVAKDLYDKDRILSLPTIPQQKRQFIEHMKHGKSLIYIINSMLNLNHMKYDQLLEDLNEKQISVEDGLEKMNDNLVALYFASEKNARLFQADLRDLVKSYCDKEMENLEVIRPYSFIVYGINSKEVLDRRNRKLY